jgi:brefeldin A-inhibited guanine nucleotide-exchange protein
LTKTSQAGGAPRQVGAVADKRSDSREIREGIRAEVMAQPLDAAGEMFACLSSERLTVLLDCLVESHEFARKFNANMPLRVALFKASFMNNRTKPNLLKQETTSLMCNLRIMFRMYGAEAHAPVADAVEAKILGACTTTLSRFTTSIPPEQRVIWAPLVNLILKEILALDDDKFAKFAGQIYGLCTELIVLAYDKELKQVVFFLAKFFERTRGFVL